ncbi:MAG TPA: penicillin-binding protein 2 [Bacteroidales bacterium]|nr:penicillin-binding protein 2 [Bacteroidales bacterium]
MRNPYINRRVVVEVIIIVVGAILTVRLFYLQIINQSFKLSASNNVLRYVTQYPARGLIFDRNGEVLVFNEAAYDLMVVPRLARNIDTLALCQLIGIDKETYKRNMVRARKYSAFKPSVFESQLSKETFGFLQEQLFKFPGFFVQPRTIRQYTHPIAAHALGYIGEVSPATVKRDPYYEPGDYIGISGIERTYEPLLRGNKGVSIKMVDVHNRIVGSFKDGQYDTLAEMGQNIHITLDATLQAYGEALMRNKRGSIVAIEPSTGEILALVSSPSFDPGLLSGRTKAQNYEILFNDPAKPLFNRALMAMYPPGSTFKMAIGLSALHRGVISPHTGIACQGIGSQPIRCSHNHRSPLQLDEAIEHSCNPYFWISFRAIIENPRIGNTVEAFNLWRNDMLSFGLNAQVGYDLFGEQPGKIPTAAEYDGIYGKGRWRALTIRSLSIGQGEILVTPVQLANMAVIFANRGFYYQPHLLRAVGDAAARKPLSLERRVINASSLHVEEIVRGMDLVFSGSHGTARWFALDDIPMSGKTGTVENPHGKAHSMFIAFAPTNQPRIAISVVVENAGYGATWAVPIATLMMEKYLKGEISRKDVEERIMNAIIM